MTVVIEDTEVLAELERLATGLALPAEEVVRQAVLEKAKREPTALLWKSRTDFDRAVQEFQTWSESHRQTDETQPADDILGYNEHGLFD